MKKYATPKMEYAKIEKRGAQDSAANPLMPRALQAKKPGPYSTAAPVRTAKQKSTHMRTPLPSRGKPTEIRYLTNDICKGSIERIKDGLDLARKRKEPIRGIMRFCEDCRTHRAGARRIREAAVSDMSAAKTQFKRDWFILTSLVSKDFKLKYRRSMLGVLWSVLNPLLMMIVLTAVFSVVFRFDIPNFPVYLILGQTLFTFMSDATSGAMSSIIDSAPLIKKIRINKMLFPLEKVVFSLLNFAISLVAVAAVIAFFQIPLTWNILLLPLLLFYIFLFCLGLGLLLSSLAVFFRDVMHLWGVVLTAWTYATPLFYPTSILTDWMWTIMQFNPMYYYVTYFRDIALNGVMPSLGANVICLGCGVATLVIGFAVFRKQQKKFILYV